MLYQDDMRTTLEIDDDILVAAKAMARQQQRTLGHIVSALARKALERPATATRRNGVPLLPARPGIVVTSEIVNALRDETA